MKPNLVIAKFHGLWSGCLVHAHMFKASIHPVFHGSVSRLVTWLYRKKQIYCRLQETVRLRNAAIQNQRWKFLFHFLIN